MVKTSDNMAADARVSCAPDKSTVRGFELEACWGSLSFSVHVKTNTTAYLEGSCYSRVRPFLPASTTFPIKGFHFIQIPPLFRLIITRPNGISSDHTSSPLCLPILDCFLFLFHCWRGWRIDGRYWIDSRNLRQNKMCSFQRLGFTGRVGRLRWQKAFDSREERLL